MENPLIRGAIALVAGLTLVFLTYSPDIQWGELLLDYGAYLFLGVLGAIFANSTGAGGGVVFIPAFGQLGFTEMQAVATSFGIQCFGMTAGALTWYTFFYETKSRDPLWQPFVPAILIGSICSVSGLWLVYALNIPSFTSLSMLFGVFSLLLGAAILIALYRSGLEVSAHPLTMLDYWVLGTISFGGGIVTAWLSVGVGEFIAFYLILRRYDAAMAVGVAVVVTALTVWSAAPKHFIMESLAYPEVLLMAGPGAVIGGLIARHLVAALSASHLKAFFGVWLLVIGLVELIS